MHDLRGEAGGELSDRVGLAVTTMAGRWATIDGIFDVRAQSCPRQSCDQLRILICKAANHPLRARRIDVEVEAPWR